MLKFDILIDVNVDVHKFIGDIDWSKGYYDRQIIEGLMLHTFRYSKHIIWSQMNNSDLSKSIFSCLINWNPEYFDPIDIESWVLEYKNIYSLFPKQFPEYKDDDEEDELTKEYLKLGILITHKDKYEYKYSWFQSTFVQEHVWAWFDNEISLFGQDSNRKFVVGDMFVDAAMCYSQELYILEKIQRKYSIDSLIKALSFNKEWFHFWEGVVCLLRSCYFSKCTQSLTESQDRIDNIKKGIIDHLNSITDLNNIEQLEFATQAIMLVTNLYCRLDNQDKDQLSTIISNLAIKLLEDFQVYAIPNVFDFLKNASFLEQKVIDDNRKLIENEVNNRNVILETHQKQFVLAIWNLIKKSDLNQLSISKVQYNSNFLKSLNLESHMIEKFFVLFILKYIDIPFDEEFTDELVDVLLFLQTGSPNNEDDSGFVRLCKTIQDVIVSIHNCEVKQKIEDLNCINDLMDQLKFLRDRLQTSQKNRGIFRCDKIDTNQVVDLEIALILGELLYKVRWNSNFKELRHSKHINYMLIKIYKTLGYLMESNENIWVKLWHFSQKMFCINWWNQVLNRYHSEFLIRWVSKLNANKTTQYTIDLFSNVWKNIGEVILIELSNANKNNSLVNLINLFKEIGEEYRDRVMFNNPKTRSIFNFLSTTDFDLQIDLFCNHIMMSKFNKLGKHKSSKVKM